MGAIAPHPESFTIGARPGGTFGFIGDVDEIAVYDRALSADRVRAHFEARGL